MVETISFDLKKNNYECSEDTGNGERCDVRLWNRRVSASMTVTHAVKLYRIQQSKRGENEQQRHVNKQ